MCDDEPKPSPRLERLASAVTMRFRSELIQLLYLRLGNTPQNIRALLSSEVDFPKAFSHVVGVEISKFQALRARYRNSVFLRARARGHGDTGISLALP